MCVYPRKQIRDIRLGTFEMAGMTIIVNQALSWQVAVILGCIYV